MKQDRYPVSSYHASIVMFGIFFLALIMRLPFISAGLPYFYDEDEAHHFNRLAEMAKSGDLNPRYFHKPSLHFYLRLPFVETAIQYAKIRGTLNETGDLRTRDKFGLAGYLFSTSHPVVVKAARLVSLLASLGIVLLTYAIAFKVFASRKLALMAALCTALSPALIEYSAVVNVDTMMAFFCLLAVYLGLRCKEHFSLSKLLITALISGLAVSTKYNAAPIAVIPLLLCLTQRKRNWKMYLIAFTAPALGFLIGTPYILSSVPLFIEHVRYEVWHYAVAGHVGNEATPGIGQILFYSTWLTHEALGWGLSICALFGLLMVLRTPNKTLALFLAFPLLYFLLMISQKVNFPRNMLVIVPFLSITAAAFLRWAIDRHSRIFILFVILVLVEPAILGLQKRQYAANLRDTRVDAAEWILKERPANSEIALAGNLQFAPQLRREPSINTVDTSKVSAENMYEQGYDLLVAHSTGALPKAATLLKEFPGNPVLGRVVNSPAISIVRFNPQEMRTYFTALKTEALALPLSQPDDNVSCSQSTTEPYCWINTRFMNITAEVPADIAARFPFRRIAIEVMSPWPEQQIRLAIGTEEFTTTIAAEDAGKWKIINTPFRVNQLSVKTPLLAEIQIIHSPYELQLSADRRRLGLALKRFVLLSE